MVPAGCDPGQAEAARAVAQLAEGLGLGVEERAFPAALAARADRVARTVLTASLAEWMGFLGVPGEELTPIAAAVLAEGRGMGAAELFAASREMAVLTAEWEAWMAGVDAVISPVLARSVPKVGAFDMQARDAAAHFAQMGAVAPGAAMANASGFPALVIPYAGGGISVGVQIAGRVGCDRALLALGARLAAATPVVAYPYAIAGHP
jgi:amidase